MEDGAFFSEDWDAWEDDYGLECDDDGCWNSKGEFIGEFDDKDSQSACDTGYCFIEMWGCMDTCIQNNCPGNTCYPVPT